MELNTTIARKIISLFPQFAFMTYQSHAEDVNVLKYKHSFTQLQWLFKHSYWPCMCLAVTSVHAQKLSPELNLNFDLG